MNSDNITKRNKDTSAWCMTDEEKADCRGRDLKALLRAKEMEELLRGRLVTSRMDNDTIITATPGRLAVLLATQPQIKTC